MKCLIVDDDPLICDLIEHFCSKINDISSVTTTTSGFESINLINSTSFDIIFLDFNLNDITAKGILETVGHNTCVIMITSNKGFASDSYNYDQIVDFLVKPIDFPRFFKAFQKAKNHLSKNQEKETRLFIKDGNKLVKIELEAVMYFKSEANYISVVTEDKKILTLMTLKDLLNKLPDYFQRVHRSYIVNLNKIDSINNNMVELGENHIPISQSYEKELLTKINLLN
ncbi:LytTR family DNA-binding domain-containing protein [Flavobacteriaceae bacterium XHP0103]|uniref:LytR/AlgR family response regulator transcription factor n=1 Tax=Marixanthotalea marina TaxID=2844359 RepID=UPI002989B3CA|nr:LytTR family DNA-binding domain-containing protein [Marixanthotalea marina]MBU3821102.1 LytTR family DNA-binding domain-containing protein [Marixanthotalea marina]